MKPKPRQSIKRLSPASRLSPLQQKIVEAKGKLSPIELAQNSGYSLKGVYTALYELRLKGFPVKLKRKENQGKKESVYQKTIKPLLQAYPLIPSAKAVELLRQKGIKLNRITFKTAKKRMLDKRELAIGKHTDLRPWIIEKGKVVVKPELMANEARTRKALIENKGTKKIEELAKELRVGLYSVISTLNKMRKESEQLERQALMLRSEIDSTTDKNKTIE
jgi:predicted transcriptional regulator